MVNKNHQDPIRQRIRVQVKSLKIRIDSSSQSMYTQFVLCTTENVYPDSFTSV